jgi:hypothetical protein
MSKKKKALILNQVAPQVDDVNTLPPDVKNRLSEMEPDEISFVDRPANKKKLVIVLRDGTEIDTDDVVDNIQKQRVDNADEEVQPRLKMTAGERVDDIMNRLTGIRGSISSLVEDDNGDYELPDDVTADLIAVFSLVKALLERAGSWVVLHMNEDDSDKSEQDDVSASQEPEEVPTDQEPESGSEEGNDTQDSGSVTNVVPDADASNEEKRDAQKDRSDQYGIEALETNANLTYPSDGPKTEAEYGDPVNLKYPLDTKERANNARSRFKQNADTYDEDESKKVVHSRIIKAQIDFGSEPSFDSEDPLDAMLPSDIKKVLEELRMRITQSVISDIEYSMLMLSMPDMPKIPDVNDIVSSGISKVVTLLEDRFNKMEQKVQQLMTEQHISTSTANVPASSVPQDLSSARQTRVNTEDDDWPYDMAEEVRTEKVNNRRSW